MCAEFKDLADLIGEEKVAEEAPMQARSALLRGSIINEKYKVLRVITSRENRATYLVKDIKITDKKFIIWEIMPVSMSKDELKKRRDKFRQIIRILSTFRHKNLMEVYEGFTESNKEYCVMEYVEGLDLEKLTEMSTTPFAEEKVIQWGLELCDAIEFIHYRPKPFTLGDLTPKKIMVDDEGVLNIISYDLQRFFDINRTLEFMPDDPKTLYSDITKLSQVLFFLLTKEEYDKDSYKLNFPEETSGKLKKLLEITCNPDQKSVGSIKEFIKKLEDSLIPEKEEDFEKKRMREFPLINIKIDAVAFFRDAWDKFLQQNPFTIGVEVIFILFLIIYGFNVSHKDIYRRHSGARLAYVVSDRELYTIDLSKDQTVDKIVNQKELGFFTGSVLTARLKLPKDLNLEELGRSGINKVEKDVIFISDAGGSAIYLFDADNNQKFGMIKTDAAPGILIPDDENKRTFVIHRQGASISVIDMKTLTIQYIIPTGLDPVYTVYLPLSEKEKEKRKEMMEKMEEKLKDSNKADKMKGPIKMSLRNPKLPSPTLIISNNETGKIVFLDTNTGIEKESIKIEGKPGKILLSDDKSILYALDTEGFKLLAIDLETKKIKKFRLEYESPPTDMALDPITGKIWIVHQKSNAVIPFDTGTDKFGDSVTIKGKPSTIKYHNKKLWILNRRKKDIVVIDADGGMWARIQLDGVPHWVTFLQ